MSSSDDPRNPRRRGGDEKPVFRPCLVPTDVHTIVHREGETTFEWHSGKAARNRLKHGVRFADAVEIFFDPDGLSMEDPDAQEERRFVLTGLDGFGRVLTVVFTDRRHVIRLISARPASPREQKAYFAINDPGRKRS